MFTLIGICLIVAIGFLANREQGNDSGNTDSYIKYTRQDIRVAVWLLAAIVVMLGIIADRLH